MKIYITGICGFVGSSLAKYFLDQGFHVSGMDSFVRKGSELNRHDLCKRGCEVIQGDVRVKTDVLEIPKCDWIIDAAANPSVLAGLDNNSSSQKLIENNLYGTINLLEYCKETKTGLIILSTSRVYSILDLCNLNVFANNDEFRLSPIQLLDSVSEDGIDENFPTSAPISLYGASKLTSEILALEYSKLFGFDLWINRCGVLAGAGQFGKVDQGIFAFWINSWLRNKKLSYIGFEGTGFQVRDVLHPNDLGDLILKQIFTKNVFDKVYNVSGGIKNSVSLKNLSNWCEKNISKNNVFSNLNVRPFDVPHLVLNSQKATKTFDWKPKLDSEFIFNEILNHAIENPNWLEYSN